MSSPASQPQPGEHPAADASPWRWVPWGLALGIALIGAWLLQRSWAVEAENQLVRDGERLAQLELRNAQQHAEAERLLAAQQIAQLSARVQQIGAQLAERSREADEARRELTARQADLAEAHARLAEAEARLAEMPSPDR